LHRLLRALATEDVLVERADGRFDLAPAGHLLRADVPGSLRPSIMARGSLYAPAAQALPDFVRDGGVPFVRVYDRSFFDHLSQREEHATTFHASMANRSRREAGSLVSAGDFGRFRHVVEVGGGSGTLISAVVERTPTRILRRCREIAEAVLPEHAADDPEIVRRDVSMMVLTSGRERSRHDFAAILGTAGFEMGRIIATTSLSGVALLEAVPMTY